MRANRLPLLFLLFLCFSTSSFASHLKGADIYFESIGNSYYRVVTRWYFSCYAYSIPPTSPFSYPVSIDSGGNVTNFNVNVSYSSIPQDLPDYCPGIMTTCDYTPYNNAPAGTPYGTLYITYASDSFYVGPGWTATASSAQGSRNPTINNLTNPSSTSLYVEATMTTPNNGSAGFAPIDIHLPTYIIPTNNNVALPYTVTMPGTDSVSYELISTRSSAIQLCVFPLGCDSTNPMGYPGQAGSFVSSFSFDKHTGVIYLNGNTQGDYVISVRAYVYRNGVLIGTIDRDNTVTVINSLGTNSPPVLLNNFNTANVTGAGVVDSNSLKVCPGSLLQFDLIATDPDSNNFVSFLTNALPVMPGAVMTVSHRGGIFDTAIAHISWTPQVSDTGFHSLSVMVSDSMCPYPGRAFYSFSITVYKGVYAFPKNQIYCTGGQPVIISAYNGQNWAWTDLATGGPALAIVSYGPDSSSIAVAPSSAHGYVVTSSQIGQCSNRDTVYVGIAPLFALTTTAQDSVVCKYSSTTVSTVASPSNLGPFTYSWHPNTSGNASATTGPVLGNSSYFVDVTSAGGCIIHDAARVRMSGASPRIVITPSTNNVCPGDTVLLSTNVSFENLVSNGMVDTCPTNSGYNTYYCSRDTNQSTGTTFTTVAGSPFRGNYNAYKAQYLFHPSELNAAGLSSGTITDISFFVTGINSVIPYDTFRLSMGTTTADSLSGFIDSLTEVYSPRSVTPNLGWTFFALDHFYNWDGVSNLVVQVCYTIDSNLFSNDDYVAYVNSPFGGSVYWQADFSGIGCALTTNYFIGGATNTRPIIRISDCSPIDAALYHWTPMPPSGIDSTPYLSVAVTQNNTVYHFAANTASQCNSSDSIVLHTSPYLATQPNRQITGCNGDTVTLNIGFSNPYQPTCIQDYNVSSIPYAPLSGTQTVISSTSYFTSSGAVSADDGTSGPISLPHPFRFYCESYNQIWVNANGWISFVNPYLATPNPPVFTAQYFPPSALDLNPQKMITLMTSDYQIIASSTIGYFATGVAPNYTFVIQFNGLEGLNNTYYKTSGQIQLHMADGSIDILIDSSNFAGVNHTTGIKDSTGIGLAAPGRNNVPYTISTPEAWHFAPVNPAPFVQTPLQWSPNLYLSSDTALNPRANPPAIQKYYVDANILINPTTAPSVCHIRDSVTVNIDQFTHTLSAGRTLACPGDTTSLHFNTSNTLSAIVWSPSVGLTSPHTASTIDTIMGSVTYTVSATDIAGCSVRDTIAITASADCVWPGDANSDRMADNTDILYIGIAFGDTGAVRPAASLIWTGQSAPVWDSTFTTGVNCVHADCDGNGVVDYNDTLAVHLNFGLTHPKTYTQRQGGVPITISTDKNLYGINDTMKVTISTGDNTLPIPKIYGMAYKFDVATASSCRIISIRQSDSWIGQKLNFEKLTSGTTAYLAQSRINHRDTAGYGTIAEIEIVSDAVISNIDSAIISVGPILALTTRGDTVLLAPGSKTVAVSQHPLGIESISDNADITLYPNPNTGSFKVVQSSATKTKMTVTDELGRVVYEMNLSDKITTVDLGKVPSGIYTATFTSAASHVSKRVVLRR